MLFIPDNFLICDCVLIRLKNKQKKEQKIVM